MNISLQEIRNKSSEELINILSNLGFCKSYSGISDTRKAYISEFGKLTESEKNYVKIIVVVDDNIYLDFGIRLYVM